MPSSPIYPLDDTALGIEGNMGENDTSAAGMGHGRGYSRTRGPLFNLRLFSLLLVTYPFTYEVWIR